MVEGEALTCLHTIVEELQKSSVQMNGLNYTCIPDLPMIKN